MINQPPGDKIPTKILVKPRLLKNIFNTPLSNTLVVQGEFNVYLPPMVFGTFPLIGAVLCLLLPETRGAQLPQTIEDGERFGLKTYVYTIIYNYYHIHYQVTFTGTAHVSPSTSTNIGYSKIKL